MEIRTGDIVEVNAEKSDNDLVEHDFTGTVVFAEKHFSNVRDQEDNVFIVANKSITEVKE